MIDIFIGSSSNGEDAEIEAVYEYTLRKNASQPLTLHWMRQTKDTSSFWSGFKTSRWSTPFSGFRWAIPEYMGFEGKVIYTDCDMINFRDIVELYNTDLDIVQKPFAARKGVRFGGHEFCVMVIDCAQAEEWLIPVARQQQIAEYHHRCISKFSGNTAFVQDLDPRWNVLDGSIDDANVLNSEQMWQLHWTKMSTQPWKPAWFTGDYDRHPRKDLVELFEKLKIEAADAGYLASNYKPNTEPVKYDIIGR